MNQAIPDLNHPPNPPFLSVIFAITGDYSKIHPPIDSLIKNASNRLDANGIELILVLQNNSWLRIHNFNSIKSSKLRILVLPDTADLPALLFNRGAIDAQGRYISFAWPGIDLDIWFEFFKKIPCDLTKSNAVFLAGRPSSKFVRDDPLHSWKHSNSDAMPLGYQGGWIEMLDYVPMHCSFVSREYFLRSGGFSCSPLLQRGFWWEFSVRTARTEQIELFDAAIVEGPWSCWSFPLNKELSLSGDLIARRVVRRTGTPTEISCECDWNDVALFSNDLSRRNRQRLKRHLLEWASEDADKPSRIDILHNPEGHHTSGHPLKIVVLGGLNEPAHNQLCFFNYFALLEGQGILTWRTILDTTAHPVDLIKADLVIFSRVKSKEGCNLMDYCNENQIETVYMLDDNWFSVGRDWPEYAEIFTPGAPLYDNFLYCLKRANRVLTYNKVLAEDLRPHNSHLYLLPTNIDMSLFKRSKKIKKQRLRVGYVGSLRKEDSAFIALRQLAKERDDFDVFVMSSSIPDALHELSQNRLIYQPYVFGYGRYAQVLCDAGPDILLAPLGPTRTDASKCPNKYLEITAAGSVGIYSNTPPYDQYLSNGQNGLLVDNDVESWRLAINLLIDTPLLREEMLSNAEKDVSSNFNTSAVLPIFLEFLMNSPNSEFKKVGGV